jgi:flagellar hook-basal body complex protein FliE
MMQPIALQSLSPEEVISRMRELTARAQLMQARTALGSVDQLSGSGAARRGYDAEALDAGERLDFQTVLKDAVRGISDAQQTAQSKAQAYQLGDDKVSLEDVMISIQKASLAMQGMVQVRNRLVESYREVMNMQV